MSADIKQRGRPRGADREALTGWMAGRAQFTMGELSRSLGWPIDAANRALQRAKQAGEVRINGSVASGCAKRPVAVFEPVALRGSGGLGQPSYSGHAGMMDCMQRWGR